jgi:hypothetical protein
LPALKSLGEPDDDGFRYIAEPKVTNLENGGSPGAADGQPRERFSMFP